MSGKVYCEDCKYIIELAPTTRSICGVGGPSGSWYSRNAIGNDTIKCQYKNLNNDCEDFEKKGFLDRLFRLVGS